MNNEPIDHSEAPIKLHDQRAIGLATYLGGPLAAGILIRRNFINLGKADSGTNALIISILSTIGLIAMVFAIPEPIMDKVPSMLIPILYTGIIILILQRIQGKDLEQHKTNNGEFYSIAKAGAVGGVCLIVFLAGVFGYAYVAPDDFDTAKYDKGIEEFGKNEEAALELYDILDRNSLAAVDFIDNVGVNYWLKNLVILDELDNIDGLYQEFKDQNEVLRKYCQLRIQSFKLIKKSIEDETSAYEQRINEIYEEIDVLLGES